MVEENVSQTEETQEAQSETAATVETGEDKKETTGLIGDAYRENERMEKNLIERRKLLEEEKEFHAKKMLAGRGAAGEPSKTAEEVSKEKLNLEIAESVNRFS